MCLKLQALQVEKRGEERKKKKNCCGTGAIYEAFYYGEAVSPRAKSVFNDDPPQLRTNYIAEQYFRLLYWTLANNNLQSLDWSDVNDLQLVTSYERLLDGRNNLQQP